MEADDVFDEFEEAKVRQRIQQATHELEMIASEGLSPEKAAKIFGTLQELSGAFADQRWTIGEVAVLAMLAPAVFLYGCNLYTPFVEETPDA